MMWSSIVAPTLCFLTLTTAMFYLIKWEISRRNKEKARRLFEDSWKESQKSRDTRFDKKKMREAEISYISSWRLVFDERTGRYVKRRQVSKKN